jgi:hypothetical protein
MIARWTLAIAAATALSTTFFLIAAVELPSGQACAAQAAKPRVSFADDVLPLLKFRCGACHLPGGEGVEKSGFEVSSYETVMRGTQYGAVVVPGDPDVSNLMRLLDWRVGADIRMPHGKMKLSVCDRDVFRTWILEGAQNN